MWDHTDESFDKSKELTDLSSYKDQIEENSHSYSPRNKSFPQNWPTQRASESKNTRPSKADYAARKLSSSSPEYSTTPTRKSTTTTKDSPRYQKVTPPRPSIVKPVERQWNSDTKVTSKSASNVSRTQNK